MRTIAWLFLSVLVFAEDPVHTEKDLAPELKPLAWLLGNWEGEGTLGETSYNDWSRSWPSADGKSLFKTAYAADTSGSVIHEEFMVFWHSGTRICCDVYETGPARVTEFTLKFEEESFELVACDGTVVSREFRREDEDLYSYRGNAGVANTKGKSRRVKGDHAPRGALDLSEDLQLLKLAVGEFEGKGAAEKHEERSEFSETVKGRPVLGGEFLEITTLRTAGGTSELFLSLVWKEDGKWRVHKTGMSAFADITANEDILELKISTILADVRRTWTKDRYDWTENHKLGTDPWRKHSDGLRVK